MDDGREAPRAARVKNKSAASVQITAEQILREAKDRTEGFLRVPEQRIVDEGELLEYRGRKRKGFEDSLRKDRTNIGAWIKYAGWEESQTEMERARSIFERGLDVDHRAQALWLKYAEMEMRYKNVNRARNVFDRAVQILPRVDSFWYKYAYMEELLENVAGARQVFERWLTWKPTEEAWMAYVKMELRYGETEKARDIYKRFVEEDPVPRNWLKWAKFEEGLGAIDRTRHIYESCINTLGQDFIDQNFYVSFAKFESRQKEFERARAIYKHALEVLPAHQKANLYNVYTAFEKQHGAKEGIEDVVLTKRRKHYEEELAQSPLHYDLWFDYVRLEEEFGDQSKVRDVYERAISQVPLIKEKRFWARYVYLWLFYAIWEESVAEDPDRAKQVYSKAIQVIPHKFFTFAKVWLQYAQFLIRQYDLAGARKVMGTALGLAGKEKLFKGYISLELGLRDFDRVRTLYQKYLEWSPSHCSAWSKFAELEKMLGDSDRARGIYEIAIAQPLLDMPEVIWKGYIDFEVEEGEWARARGLYEQLLSRTQHVKVWMSFAEFERIAMDNGDESGRAAKARDTYSRAYAFLKKKGVKDERVVLLDAWTDFEKEFGTSETLEDVESKAPRSVKKRRRLMDDQGQPAGWEEYIDYIFPDDEEEKPNLKLLAMAHQWKQKMAEMQGNGNKNGET